MPFEGIARRIASDRKAVLCEPDTKAHARARPLFTVRPVVGAHVRVAACGDQRGRPSGPEVLREDSTSRG